MSDDKATNDEGRLGFPRRPRRALILGTTRRPPSGYLPAVRPNYPQHLGDFRDSRPFSPRDRAGLRCAAARCLVDRNGASLNGTSNRERDSATRKRVMSEAAQMVNKNDLHSSADSNRDSHRHAKRTSHIQTRASPTTADVPARYTCCRAQSSAYGATLTHPDRSVLVSTFTFGARCEIQWRRLPPGVDRAGVGACPFDTEPFVAKKFRKPRRCSSLRSLS